MKQIKPWLMKKPLIDCQVMSELRINDPTPDQFSHYEAFLPWYRNNSTWDV